MKLLILFIFFPFAILAQSLQGRVVDSHQVALAFTSIWVENTNQGTLANEDGQFEIHLMSGKNRLVFRHVGFAPRTIDVDLASQEIKRDFIVQMQEQAVSLEEVNIRALKEDPAIGIIRRMISMAPFHLKELNAYQAKAYIKGNGKINSISKLANFAFGKQLENDAGIKVGRTYVLEAINQVDYKRPNQIKERVISNRNNLPLAMKTADAPNLRATQTNFYMPKVWGTLISPVSPAAFQFYNFSFLGSFSQGGKTISKIQVRPKSFSVDLFDGELLVVEDTWSIYSLRLNFKNGNGNFTLSQQNAEFQGVWMPINYEMRANMQALGLGFSVNYVTQVKSYQIQVNPGFVVKPQIIEERLDKTLAKEIDKTPINDVKQSLSGDITRKKLKRVLQKIAKEEKKSDTLAMKGISAVYDMQVDSLANKKSIEFWNEAREVPLTEAELSGFKEADSLYVIERAKMVVDSINALPKFKLQHLFYAKKYNFEKAGIGNSFMMNMLGFGLSPVDGYYLDRNLNFNRQLNTTDYWKIGANIHVGFQRKALNGDVYFDRKSHEGRALFNVTTGSQLANQSDAKTITSAYNSSTSLLTSKSYLYWYQKDFVRIFYEYQVRASLILSAQIEYRNRSMLSNVVKHGWFGLENEFRENVPISDELSDTRFQTHKQWSLGAFLTWKPGSTWRLINHVRREERSENNFTLKFNTQVVLGDYPFSNVSIQADQSFSLGRLGRIAYQVRYQDYLKKPSIYLDFTHFNGSDINVISSQGYVFSTLPMYTFSTSGQSLIFHVKWSPRKFLLSQQNSIYLYGIRESLRFSALYTQNRMGKDGFYELAYSTQGIFKSFGLELAKPIGNWVPSQWKVSLTLPF
jgi:hypothetical protein